MTTETMRETDLDKALRLMNYWRERAIKAESLAASAQITIEWLDERLSTVIKAQEGK